MKRALFALVLLFIVLNACGQGSSSKKDNTVSKPENQHVTSQFDTDGKTIDTRFVIPQGFRRITADSASFAYYLRNLPLKPSGAPVTYFDGRTKPNRNIYDAVVDLPIGKRDLHQCADAVIRLRAEYFFEEEKYDSIHFNFTNGFNADYPNWQKGKRIVVDGNKVFWKQSSQASDSYKSFWKYLEMVFSYAGTASLEKELKPTDLEEMKIGNVFIKGGFPGHAVIVVDMAVQESTGEKVFLLAQSYMPAQEIQILKNPINPNLSPWYSVDFGNTLKTPEWTFKKSHLKRF
ncbi:DUF4846 domain-containing protein [Maribacter halichondriae]|uniref:DUF4846 domain-containing protein n=1 Tax=Maribacter halichondriae TaxID=2980554 RepID=UPI002359C350|nr:DUF4846 domain-containing protein [Maribacter sp. Hal144]